MKFDGRRPLMASSIQENPTQIDTSLSLSLLAAVSRNPSIPSWIRDNVASDDLGNASSNSTDVDDDCIKGMETLWFLENDYFSQPHKSICVLSNPSDADDVVDTMLRLSMSDSDSRKSDKAPSVTCNQIVVPFKLSDSSDEEDEVDTRLSLSPPGFTDKKRKNRRETGENVNQIPRRKKVKIDSNDENQQPSLPIEEIPLLFQTLKSRGGSGSVFLYRKELTGSDVTKEQKRVFVTREERVKKFLREEEAAEVYGKGKGMKMVGVDGRGEVFLNMGLTKWESLKMLVINSDWWKMVDQNKVVRGDLVEVWGYRENEKPCLAFNFVHAASSSSNNGTVFDQV